MDKDQMALLFDIDISDSPNEKKDESSDYSTTAEDKAVQEFGEKIKDMRVFMEPETDNDIINKAIEQADNPAAKKPKRQVEEIESDGNIVTEDFTDEIRKDMKEFEVSDDSSFQDASPEILDGPGSDEDIPDPEVIIPDDSNDLDEDIPDSNSGESDSNPLGLFPSELKEYDRIKKDYPMFPLYDGSVTFREFYHYKFITLKSLLNRFRLLDLKSIKDEVCEINLDHYVGDDYISPEILQRKIDQTYQARVRLSSLLISIFEQQPAWVRWCEMLRSKLWKDHDLKGAHRRDGLTIEHMGDVEDYVSVMQGVLESAKHADTMLKAASESLSRQLTCLQIKQATGFIDEPVHSKKKNTSNKLDGFDDIETGTSISAPKTDRKPDTIAFGSDIEVDDLSQLG
jgi:hypothetical protein